MGRVQRYPGGTFCWVQLTTPDVDQVVPFYEGLLGWRIGREDGGMIARLDDLRVAGLASSPDAAPGWSTSVAVYDVAETARRAGELGGQGSAERIRDPAGAELGLRPATPGEGAEIVNELGTWTWSELATPDLDAAASFYGELFGWTVDAPDGPIERRTFLLGDLLIGAAHQPQPGEPPEARWGVTFRVADARAAAERVRALGGQVLLEPFDIPIGTMTVVADPEGAVLTLTNFAAPTRGVDGS